MMELGEKLQQLRKQQNMTQEELAEKLFVSRTAISKWESGRGCPGIDSLKGIAAFFHTTIDELVSGQEMMTLAESDMKSRAAKNTALVCGVLDCMFVMLLFLPFFGQQGPEKIDMVPLVSMTGVSAWQKAVFLCLAGFPAANGLAATIVSSFDRPLWGQRFLNFGLASSIASTLFFMISRQPYAGVFCLLILVFKGFLLLKNR